MSTITKDLGVVTAYGYYKAGGGTMIESEFTQFMVDFGTASKTATEAAQAAAESAQASAASSVDAQDSAEEAKQSASIASTRAIEADTAAETAIDAKNDAVTAQTAAETAQGKAEDAQAAAAQSASEAAESARTLTIDATLTQSGQAADALETGKIKEDIENNFHINGNVKPDLIVGSFVDASNNSIGASSNFSMTSPIPVKKGQKITLTARGYNTFVGMIATCNSDNTSRATVAKSVDSTDRTYTYNVTEEGYVVCSFNNNYPYRISIEIDYYSLFDDIDLLGFVKSGTENIPLTVQVADSFIDTTTNNIGTSDNFFISQSITLYKGQTINLTVRGYRQFIGMINEYQADTQSYAVLVKSIDSTDRTYSFTATKTTIIRCSLNKLHPYSAEIVTPVSRTVLLDNVHDEIDALNDPLKTVKYPQMFSNIICMGDSLTRGESGGSQSVQLSTNYPFYFKKMTQAEVTNQSQGGITAQGFWNTFASTYDYTPFDCAVIFLGTNGGLTDTVDTDCNVDYTQNADTNTGCYGKIIGRIKETAPDCKIFIVAGVNDYVRRATKMNSAVRALAEFYNVGLIDVEDCIMSDSGGGATRERYLYRPIDGIHYNRLGYMTLANMIYDAMSDYMSKHRDMYA